MGKWEPNQGISDEWYTPLYIFSALNVQFDLDVASPKNNKTFVPCNDKIYENSLIKPWYGFIWMNPPFGKRNGIEPWLNKFFEHGNGLALTPDRTSAPWFRKAYEKSDSVLFTPKIRFLRPDGTEGKAPSNGTAIFSIRKKGTRIFN